MAQKIIWSLPPAPTLQSSHPTYTLGVQIAQSRYCSYTLGRKAGITYRLGALGIVVFKPLAGVTTVPWIGQNLSVAATAVLAASVELNRNCYADLARNVAQRTSSQRFSRQTSMRGHTLGILLLW